MLSASPPEPMTEVVAPSTRPASVCFAASFFRKASAAGLSPASERALAARAIAEVLLLLLRVSLIQAISVASCFGSVPASSRAQVLYALAHSGSATQVWSVWVWRL